MYTILLLFRTSEREGKREREKKIRFVYYWLISNIREQRLVGEHVTVCIMATNENEKNRESVFR
jgi:hypothetical protein